MKRNESLPCHKTLNEAVKRTFEEIDTTIAANFDKLPMANDQYKEAILKNRRGDLSKMWFV